MTTTDTTPDTANTALTRAVLILGGTVLGAVGWVVFLFQHQDWERDERIGYDAMAGVRDAWFTAHYWWGPLMGLGIAVTGLAVAQLLRRKGSIWGTVAGALLVVGGFGFAVGLASEGISYFVVTDRQTLDPTAGAPLLAHLMESQTYFPIFGIGLAGFSVGCLIAAVGLVVTRAVPIWVPALLVIGVVGTAVIPHAIAWWGTLPYPIAAITIAWYGVRGARNGT
ncbi:MAG: hypothetical protein GEU96_07725 [Propionibacteriales bacterium]|nr:hypothetical protein [Propionibacteriales bacterium]